MTAVRMGYLPLPPPTGALGPTLTVVNVAIVVITSVALLVGAFFVIGGLVRLWKARRAGDTNAYARGKSRLLVGGLVVLVADSALVTWALSASS